MRKFMRKSAPPPPAAGALAASHGKSNGHAPARAAAGAAAAAAGAGAEEPERSTLSRYRSGSERSRAGAGVGALFVDPEFPARPRARRGCKEFGADVVWLRPHELSARPVLLLPPPSSGAGGKSAFADENLHVAVEALALAPAPGLLARAAAEPPQSFRRDYTGAFRFRFWVFGVWRDVTVDDRLPTRGRRPLAARPAPAPGPGLPHDYTLPLLEKAYAKLYGSYGALRAGSVSRALQDLTGGVVQSFELATTPRTLTAQVLRSAVPRSTLLVAVPAPGQPDRPGRTCCLTGLACVRGDDTLLVRARTGERAHRLRMPGGAWVPGGAGWSSLPPADRDLLARRADTPGDFWMSLGEMCEAFDTLVLVHVGPDEWVREPALRSRRPWRAVLARRRWRLGYNAGGPPGGALAGVNPRFRMRVPEPCHALVSLTQQYAPGERRAAHAVGFAVYAVQAGAADTPAPALAGSGLRALDVTHESRAREVVTFFTLPAGEYLVVPHTRRAHTQASFLLRIYTDEPAHVWEVNEDNALAPDALPAAVCGCAGAGGAGAGYEVDAARLRRMPGAPPLEVCHALLPLRDPGARGAVCAEEARALLALAATWRCAYRAHAPCRGRSVSSYRARALLRAVGVTVSNKVLECLVTRYARGVRLDVNAFSVAVARLLLAHERYRSLGAKLKSNPLSLEEMILMTLYS